MRKTFILLSILLIAFSSFKKMNPSSVLRNDFDQYIHLIMNKNFKECTHYMPEKIFDLIPQDKLVDMMNQTMNDPSITYEMFEPKVTNLSNIEEIEGAYYAILKYTMKMNIKYNWEKMPDYDEGDEEPDNETILIALKAQFGKDNVSYNEETRFFKVMSYKKVAAISANGNTDWKFAVLDPQQIALAKMILPSKIIEQGLD